MAIATKRFDIFTGDTNVGLSSFRDNSSGILNTPTNAPVEISPELAAQIEAYYSTPPEPATLDTLKESVDEASRKVKGITGIITDLKKISGKYAEDLIKDTFPDAGPEVKNLVSMMSGCSAGRGGFGLPGRPYDASVNCGGNTIGVSTSGYGTSSGCNASKYGNLVDKMTGGGLNTNYNNMNSLMRALMGLSGFGYNMGMCGVFGALTKGGTFPTQLLGRASGSLLGSLGNQGNVNGAIDLMKSSAGLSTLLENPSGIKSFLSGFKIPNGTRETDLANLATRSFAGMDILSDTWSQSSYDDYLSMAETGKWNEDFEKTMQCSIKSDAYGSEDLDVIPSSDNAFFFTAYV